MKLITITGVELRGRYSNPEAREAVKQVAQVIAGIDLDGSAPSPPQVRRWRLVDRFGEQIIRQLLEDRRGGATMRELVERYGISMSSVKRILRRSRGV